MFSKRLGVRYLSTQLKKSRYNHVQEHLENLAMKAKDKPFQVLTFPGIRAVEFAKPESGNYINTALMNGINNQIELYRGNVAANVVFLASKSLYFFSNGIHEEEVSKEGSQLFQSVQNLSKNLSEFHNSASVCAGSITGTPMGLLLSCEVPNTQPFINHNIPLNMHILLYSID
jgi:hypothetical protein